MKEDIGGASLYDSSEGEAGKCDATKLTNHSLAV